MTTADAATVTLVRRRLQAATWPELVSAIAEAADWSSDTPVYAYQESVAECTLVRTPLRGVSPAEVVFEGRLFDERVDVRWMPRDAGGYRAWVVFEHSAGATDATPVRRAAIRRYYLHGIAGRNSGPLPDGRYQFEEDRYPNKQFVYPVDNAAADRDRAYIEVVEYEPPAPTIWPTDMNDAEALLNSPLLVAHRFTGVHAGTGR